MRRILLVVLSIIMISCSGGGDEVISGGMVDISDTTADTRHPITGNTEVVISGLERGSLYAIFPEEDGRSLPSRSSGPLIPTNGGTFLEVAASDELSFTGRDIGVSDGTFRIMELQERSGEAMIIEEGKDEPLFTDDSGKKVYEKNFLVDLDAIPGLDPSEASLLAILGGSGTISTDYGIISPDGSKENGKRLLDLSGMDSINIYEQLHVSDVRKAPVSYEVKLMTPVTIRENNQFILEKGTIYRINAMEGEYVLDITMDGTLNDYAIASMSPDGRYASDGERKPYIFPMKAEGDRLLIYIGSIEKDILFNFISGSGTAILRKIEADEKASIRHPSTGTIELEIPEGRSGEIILPVIFGNIPYGATVSISGDTPSSATLFLVAGSGTGYGERSLRTGYSTEVTFSSSQRLEYGFVRVNGDGGGTMRITVS